MPPQPNCPPAPVPQVNVVRGTAKNDRCYTFASNAPEKASAWLPITLCISNYTASTSCSKTPRGLLSPMEDAGLFVQLMWLHRVVGGDSGALVVPFMRVGTYPTRHLAHYCYFCDLVLTRWVCCKPPCIAEWVGLYLNCSKTISGIKSLRILESAIFAHLAFPADHLQSMAFSD